ncbi:MAG: methyl-accepting chemotaxis protein [Pseudomonadota bacterium]
MIHAFMGSNQAPAVTISRGPGKGEPLLSFTRKAKIGVKFVFGVALASNICILLLLSSIHHWDKQLSERTENLLDIQKGLNMHLRESVTTLQKRLLSLPELLETDTGEQVMNWLKQSQTILSQETLSGRQNFKDQFSRDDRRDLANGKFIIQEGEGCVIISRGIVNNDNGYAEGIHRIKVKSHSPSSDVETMTYTIMNMMAQGLTPQSMRNSLQTIRADIAEDLLSAELSRTEMLSKLELIGKTQTAVSAARKKKQIFTVLIGFLTILANIMVILHLTRFIITRPLKGIIRGLQGIARGDGDLTQDLVIHSKDELGELAHWFNSFVLKLSHIIVQLQAQMDKLNRTTRELSQVSGTLREKASHMNDMATEAEVSTGLTVKQIEIMAESAETANKMVTNVTQSSLEVTGAMDFIGNSARDVSVAVASVAASIEEMNASFNEITKNTSRGSQVSLAATQQAQSSTTIIRDLRSSAGEIHEIVALIKGIADQTHLLSLNAAIEAAGAGEAGRGFSVVAKEVKELSKRTSRATATIQEKIETMQANTDMAINSIVSISKTINETHDIMSSIATSVEEQTAITNEIAKSTSETSLFAETVSTTLANTIGFGKDVSKKLEHLSTVARKIVGNAADSFDQTRQTLQNVTAVKTASVKTFNDTRLIEQQIGTLTQMSQELQRVVVQFKTRQPAG